MNFPDYFRRFKLPDGAREELIKDYRACRSGKILYRRSGNLEM